MLTASRFASPVFARILTSCLLAVITAAWPIAIGAAASRSAPVDRPIDAAVRALLDGRPSAAQAELARAIATDAKDASLHGLLAVTRRLSGDLAGALRAYNEARRLDPRLEDVSATIATAVVRQNRHPRFRIVLRQVADATKPGPEGFAWLAGLLANRDLLSEADVVLHEGRARYGDHLTLLRVDAHVIFRRGRYSPSIAAYQEAIRRHALDAGLWTNLGWSLLRAGYPVATMRAWERALALDPKNAALARDLARLRHRTPA